NGPQVAVFDFTSISISSGVTVDISGARPLALLSRGDAAIQTSLSVNNLGYLGGVAISNVPAPGPGPRGGQIGFLAVGLGGCGGVGGSAFGSPVGGAPYGNLLQTLQGGSGGGSNYYPVGSGGSSGGDGGGGIEIVAVGSLIAASITASGNKG